MGVRACTVRAAQTAHLGLGLSRPTLFLLERLRNIHQPPDDVTSAWSDLSPASLPGVPGTAPISGFGVFTEPRCRRPKLPLPLPPASVRCTSASRSPGLASARACAPAQKTGETEVGGSLNVVEPCGWVWVRESGLWSPLSAGAFQFVASICRLRRLGTREGRARHVSDVREVVRPREAKCTYLRARGRRPVVPVKLLCTPDACTSPPHHNPLTTHISLQRWCRGAQPNCANRTTLVRPPRPCRMLQPRPPSATQPAMVKSQPPAPSVGSGEATSSDARRSRSTSGIISGLDVTSDAAAIPQTHTPVSST